MSKLTYALATIAIIGTLTAFVSLQSTQRNLLSSPDTTVEDLWAHWKVSYGKSYATAEEEAHKFLTFSNNYNFVTKWNAGQIEANPTSSVGLNEFADLNTAEFSALKGCLSMKGMNLNNNLALEESVSVKRDGEVPASLDWRAKGAVTPIKNQGQCGSCWSFSTTGTLEGLNFLQSGKLLSFSEEQLVDCSQQYGNQGCDGGWPFWALEYVAANGIELESTYPYDSEDGETGACTYDKSQVVFTNKGYGNVTANNQNDMVTQILVQPISICVEADQPVFQLYTGGVITSASCGTQIDHAILAVGYSSTGTTDYWIVKNSWGTSWGLAGYLYIEKSTTKDGPGVCGIAQIVAYAT